MSTFKRNWEIGCCDEHYIGESSYPDCLDESSDFEVCLHSKNITAAHQKSFSRLCGDLIQYGGWCKPCHVIFVRTRLGLIQTFHIHPDTLGSSHLTQGQRARLQDLGNEPGYTSYIAVQSTRGAFSASDKRDLERMKVDTHRVIELPTEKRWRALYDPNIDELWIDDTGNHLLRKYYGFRTASEGWDGVRLSSHLKDSALESQID